MTGARLHRAETAEDPQPDLGLLPACCQQSRGPLLLAGCFARGSAPPGPAAAAMPVETPPVPQGLCSCWIPAPTAGSQLEGSRCAGFLAHLFHLSPETREQPLPPSGSALGRPVPRLTPGQSCSKQPWASGELRGGCRDPRPCCSPLHPGSPRGLQTPPLQAAPHRCSCSGS